MINENTEAFSSLRELFKYAFKANCQLDSQPVTIQELNCIETFNSVDLLENFRDLIISLLKFKMEFKGTEATSTFQKDIFKEIVMKHEKEIQIYSKTQSELLSQIEKIKGYESSLTRNYELAIQKIKNLEAQALSAKQKKDPTEEWEMIKEQFIEQIERLNSRIDSREKNMKKLEAENHKLKEHLEEKFIEVEMLKQEGKWGKQAKPKETKNQKVEFIKKQGEKSFEYIQNLQRQREKNSSRNVLKEVNTDKKIPSNDFSKIYAPAYESKLQKKHVRSFSDKQDFY